MYSLACVCVCGGGGGGGGQKSFIRGGTAARSNPIPPPPPPQKRFRRGGSAARSNPLPFYEPFLTDWQKKCPFCIPSIIPSLELCIPFNCCGLNALSLKKKKKNHKMRKRVSRIFLSHKMNVSLFESFYQPKWQISLFFHKWNPYPFTNSYCWSQKKLPLSVGPPRICHYKEYPHREVLYLVQ